MNPADWIEIAVLVYVTIGASLYVLTLGDPHFSAQLRLDYLANRSVFWLAFVLATVRFITLWPVPLLKRFARRA